MKIITVLGAGYVGLTISSILSNVGYRVFVLDKDLVKIEMIKSGNSHFFDPGLDVFTKSGVESGNLIPTSSYEDAISESEIVFVCVDTPSNIDGSVCLDSLFEAVKGVVSYAQKDLIIVYKCTVPVETGKKIEKLIERHNSKGLKISLVSNPEFLREGSAVFDTLFFDRLVVGGKDSKSIDEVISVYEDIDAFSKSIKSEEFNEYAFLCTDKSYVDKLSLFEDRVIRTSLESAELIKVTSNSFLALKISFANTIARLCDKTGADSESVMRGVGSDSRIGRSFLYPGIGYGGGCFPKDIDGMINTANAYFVDSSIMNAVKKINDSQIYEALNKVKKLLGDDLNGKNVAFLGLSYKAGTSDVRRSNAVKLLSKILHERMNVKAYDPKAIEETKKIMSHKNLSYVDSMNDVFDDADIFIVATAWKEFELFDYSKIMDKMRTRNCLDGRGVLDKSKLEKLGYKVEVF